MRARVLVAVLLATAGLSATAEAAPALKKGSLTLSPCADPAGWWCGSLPRALDPAKPKGTHIGIDFRWLPPSGGKARGPALVAVEGGPGYPSTGSYVEYTGIYGPLLQERGLLLVDNRGTGTSDLIDCPAVQKFGGSTATDAFPGRVARCARQLERRYPKVSHAEDLFATAYAANDLSAVLRALKLGKVDLYGDSYGTFFVQSFISRHQNQLNSVILDSAYPVRELDPWYASSGETAQRAMDAVCSRDAGCAAAAGPGSATARLGELLARLRVKPISGTHARLGRQRGEDSRRTRARWSTSSRTPARTRSSTASSTPRCGRRSPATPRRCCASWRSRARGTTARAPRTTSPTGSTGR